MDGPSVNWVVLDKLDDLLVENGHTKTVQIDSCVQHTVHGSFQTGIANTGWDICKRLKAMCTIHSARYTCKTGNLCKKG